MIDKLKGRRYSILFSVMLGGIMGPIDASIVNVILPTISQSFKVSIALSQWVPMVYLLTISSLLLFYGRLGDIFGYKNIFLTGLGGFVVVSCFCGFSPTIYFLIAFRALQGLFAGMMMSVSFAIITSTFPTEERGKAIGINAISTSAGLAIGPSLGGFITSLLGWRFVFYINLPIGIIAILWGLRVIPKIKGQPAKIDAKGAIISLIFLFSLLLVVNNFQNQGFNSITSFMLAVAVVSFILFIFIEKRTPEPMLNLSLFKNATFSLANISALLNFMSQYVMVFVTPFYLQRVLHFPSNRVGLIMTCFPLAVMSVAPFSGYISDRIGTTLLACVGTGLCSLSLFFMSRLNSSPKLLDIISALALFGIGTGIFQSPNTSAAMGSVPKNHLGIASGILATIRNVGMFAGIATAGLVLYSFVPSTILQKVTFDGSEIIAFQSGLKHSYITGAILAGIAVITSIFRSGRSGSPLKI